MMKADLHVHSRFCDGKNTPEEMVLSAIEKGMDCIGFTGHSYTPFETEYCMSPEGTVRYRAELDRLREKYAGQIRILTGIEEDYYSGDDPLDYDYMIGSVHYLKCGDHYMPVDGGRELLIQGIRDYFHGDALAMAEKFYETAADVVRKTGCDVIGHFDLVTIFNEEEPYLDTGDPRYRAAWMKAADTLLQTGRPFEVNLGAIARGYRKNPYPSCEIREYLSARGGKLFLTGDSHRADTLMYRFEDYRSLETVDVETVIRGFARNRH